MISTQHNPCFFLWGNSYWTRFSTQYRPQKHDPILCLCTNNNMLIRCILSLSQAFLNNTELKYLVATGNRTQDHLLNAQALCQNWSVFCWLVVVAQWQSAWRPNILNFCIVKKKPVKEREYV